jgi:hypothetical protein
MVTKFRALRLAARGRRRTSDGVVPWAREGVVRSFDQIRLRVHTWFTALQPSTKRWVATTTGQCRDGRPPSDASSADEIAYAIKEEGNRRLAR